MKIKKLAKIIWNVSGKGYLSPKAALPATFIEDMGLALNDREVMIEYDSKSRTITIRKAEEWEKFDTVL